MFEIQRCFIALVLATAAIFSTGCEREPEQRQEAVSLEDVQRETNEAFEASRRYAQQQNQQYIARVQSELDRLEARVEALKQRATNEIQGSLDETLQDLEQRRAAAMKSLEDIRQHQGNASLKELEGSLGRAMQELRQAYADAASILEGKGGARESNTNEKHVSRKPAPSSTQQAPPLTGNGARG